MRVSFVLSFSLYTYVCGRAVVWGQMLNIVEEGPVINWV